MGAQDTVSDGSTDLVVDRVLLIVGGSDKKLASVSGKFVEWLIARQLTWFSMYTNFWAFVMASI